MNEDTVKRIEITLSALKNLVPDFKQLEEMISQQMVSLQSTETNHAFLHFDRQVAIIENSCSEAVTQLEYLLTLDRTLAQLGNLRACTI